MISFCIKTNNKFDIETLPLYIGKIDLSNVVFVTKKFMILGSLRSHE